MGDIPLMTRILSGSGSGFLDVSDEDPGATDGRCQAHDHQEDRRPGVAEQAYEPLDLPEVPDRIWAEHPDDHRRHAPDQQEPTENRHRDESMEVDEPPDPGGIGARRLPSVPACTV